MTVYAASFIQEFPSSLSLCGVNRKNERHIQETLSWTLRVRRGTRLGYCSLYRSHCRKEVAAKDWFEDLAAVSLDTGLQRRCVLIVLLGWLFCFFSPFWTVRILAMQRFRVWLLSWRWVDMITILRCLCSSSPWVILSSIPICCKNGTLTF